MAKTTRAALARGFVAMLDKHSAKDAVRALAHEVVAAKLTKDIDLLVADINRLLAAKTGNLNAEVVSSHKLSASVLGEVERVIKAETGAKNVTLTTSVDESLKGGLIARTPDLQFDLSVARKLKTLETI